MSSDRDGYNELSRLCASLWVSTVKTGWLVMLLRLARLACHSETELETELECPIGQEDVVCLDDEYQHTLAPTCLRDGL
jgi:hypothetical protein